MAETPPAYGRAPRPSPGESPRGTRGGWRAEKRKRYVSVPEHGERLSARHMRDHDGGKRMLICGSFRHRLRLLLMPTLQYARGR